ncbi:hypothetical protein MPSEU_000978700 [Mayamaea pseudoterrestris]|nr:hypothetical protein MPSEU_000978700 [Mayamaea pseudoterrestris]
MASAAHQNHQEDSLSTRKKGECETIVVFGAGTVEVNGEYRFAGRANGHAHYEMKGTWEGSLATFAIFAAYDKRWYIGILELQKECYRTCKIQDASLLPPARIWWCDVDANCKGPPPILFHDGITLLDWRHDPIVSFADYEIVITVEGTTESTSYHVHKIFLSSGSAYFAGIWGAGANFAEGHENTSQICLDRLTADAFPHLLDYLYWVYANHGRIGLLAASDYWENVSLYWLADYFKIHQLTQDLDHDFEKDIAANPCSCHHYLPSAQTLGVQPRINSVVDTYVAHFSELTEEDIDDLADDLIAPTLVLILGKIEASECHGLIASQLVAAFCERVLVDSETFLALSNATVLPHIHPDAVWALLDAESKVLGAPASTTELTNLQERCIEALSANFLSIDFDDNGPAASQSPLFYCKLMAKSQEHWRSERDAAVQAP